MKIIQSHILICVCLSTLNLSRSQVDKHIRKLDSDLARFEAEIQDKAISATRNVEESSQKRKCLLMFPNLIYNIVLA